MKTIEISEEAFHRITTVASEEKVSPSDCVTAMLNSLNFQVKMISGMEQELRANGLWYKFRKKFRNSIAYERQKAEYDARLQSEKDAQGTQFVT